MHNGEAVVVVPPIWIDTGALQNLGVPDARDDTPFVGRVLNASRRDLVVRFGYIHPGFPRDLQDSHPGNVGDSVDFHFAPGAVPGAAFGVRIDNWSGGDRVEIAILRR